MNKIRDNLSNVLQTVGNDCELKMHFISNDISIELHEIIIKLSNHAIKTRVFRNYYGNVIHEFIIDFDEINKIIMETIYYHGYELDDELVTSIPFSSWPGYREYKIKEYIPNKTSPIIEITI